MSQRLIVADGRAGGSMEMSHSLRTTWKPGGRGSAFPTADLLRIQRHLLLRPEAVLGLKPLEGGRASARVADGQDLGVSRSATPRLKEMLGL